jgi:hypothetical protein
VVELDAAYPGSAGQEEDRGQGRSLPLGVAEDLPLEAFPKLQFWENTRLIG